ncbi:MAG: hypothetical protein PUG60_11865 [Lachnospiraceae bacterium]|nr:hypothetical protein [Lachnospiraceae bacterium]
MSEKQGRKKAEGFSSGGHGRKRSRVRYEMKASYKGNKRIYTVLDISADKTLDDLCEMILDAFDFDYDHLYLFNLNGRRYGEDSYYFMPEPGQKSTNVKLGKLNLSLNQKFCLLYDFGDEWEFDIQVRKIYETEEHIIDGIVSVKGQLEQYPYDGDPDDEEDGWSDELEEFFDNWNDELDGDLDDDEGMLFFRLEDSLTVQDVLDAIDEESLREMAGRFLYPAKGHGALRKKTIEEVKQQYVQTLLKDQKHFLLFLKGSAADLFYFMMTAEVDPESHILDWTELLGCIPLETEAALQEISIAMMYLCSVGVCRPELDQTGEVQGFCVCGEVRRAYEAWMNRAGVLSELDEYQVLETLANTLMFRYGVIEVENLHRLCQEYTGVKISKENFIRLLAGRLEYFDRYSFYKKEGITYLTSFSADKTEQVLDMRKQSPGLTYRSYTQEELMDIAGENPYNDIGGYIKLVETLWNSLQNEDMRVMGYIIRTITEQAMMGADSGEIIKETRSALNSCGKRMTKKLQELIREVTENMPLAIGYGYTRAELEQMK